MVRIPRISISGARSSIPLKSVSSGLRGELTRKAMSLAGRLPKRSEAMAFWNKMASYHRPFNLDFAHSAIRNALNLLSSNLGVHVPYDPTPEDSGGYDIEDDSEDGGDYSDWPKQDDRYLNG